MLGLAVVRPPETLPLELRFITMDPDIGTSPDVVCVRVKPLETEDCFWDGTVVLCELVLTLGKEEARDPAALSSLVPTSLVADRSSELARTGEESPLFSVRLLLDSFVGIDRDRNTCIFLMEGEEDPSRSVSVLRAVAFSLLSAPAEPSDDLCSSRIGCTFSPFSLL